MPRTPRPARTYATGAVTRWLRILALVGVAAVATWLALQYPSLPQTIPTHFDATGRADAWGDRASVLWLAAVMVALATLVGGLSTRPRWFNYPAAVTEQNAQGLYREGERMMVWLLVALAVVFAGLALLSTGGPGVPLVVAGLAGTIGSMIAGLVRLSFATGSR